MSFPVWVKAFARTRRISESELKQAKVAFFGALECEQLESAQEILKVIDPEFRVRRTEQGLNSELASAQTPAWELDYASLSKRHVAEWLLGEAAQNISLGLAPRSVNDALKQLELKLKLELSGFRCRVGVSRGHLLEVVIAIPLDIKLNADRLAYLAEELVSRTLGDFFCDEWLAHVDVTRIARTRGLMMLNDEIKSAETYAVSELATLAHRGARLILEQVPQQEGGSARKSEQSYTALEIPPGREGALQAERVYASTAHPEALKAVLEGLPFSSARFRRDGALFLYLSFECSGGAEARLQTLQKVEDDLSAYFQQRLESSGSGFSASEQYFDFFLLDANSSLPLLLERLIVLGPQLGIARFGLGHYDSSHRSARYEVYC